MRTRIETIAPEQRVVYAFAVTGYAASRSLGRTSIFITHGRNRSNATCGKGGEVRYPGERAIRIGK